MIYKWLRNTHLLIGLFSCLFLLMYGISSVQMAHNRWFNSKPAVTESHMMIGKGIGNVRLLARQLMDGRGLKGELAQVRFEGEDYSFRIVRPGTVYEVAYSPETGSVTIRTNVANLMGMLNRLHHVGGLWHEYALINVWAVFVGLVSAILILLSLTGIYLWFKIHSERVIGAILLTLSLGYSLTLMILIRLA